MDISYRHVHLSTQSFFLISIRLTKSLRRVKVLISQGFNFAFDKPHGTSIAFALQAVSTRSTVMHGLLS